MASDSVFWVCSPELETEWNKFAMECSKSHVKDVHSDQWLSILQRQDIQVQDERCSDGNEDVGSSSKSSSSLLCHNESRAVSPPASDVHLSLSQQQQINSLALELVDTFETGTASLSEELIEDLKSLSPSAIQHLLCGMGPQLSDQGAYTLCLHLTQLNENPWTDVLSVLKFVIFPMLSGESPNPAGAELLAGILHLSNKFPSLCASYLLKPLFAAPSAAAVQVELISRVIPSLPLPDFQHLLRHIIDLNHGPLQEWQLTVLNSFLLNLGPDVLNASIEETLLDLIPLLSASVSQMSTSELFGCLLLKVISCLKSGVSRKVYSELSAIAQQNNSFSRRAILNAIKSLQPQ